MSDNRYSHWLWHSAPLSWVDRRVAILSSWLWHKRFGRYYRNDFWHAVDGRELTDDQRREHRCHELRANCRGRQ